MPQQILEICGAPGQEGNSKEMQRVVSNCARLLGGTATLTNALFAAGGAAKITNRSKNRRKGEREGNLMRLGWNMLELMILISIADQGKKVHKGRTKRERMQNKRKESRA